MRWEESGTGDRVGPRNGFQGKAAPRESPRKEFPLDDSGFSTRHLLPVALKSLLQLRLGCPALVVELHQFHHPFGRSPTRIELEEQRGNQRQVNLDPRPLRVSAIQCPQLNTHLTQRKNSSMPQRWR